MGLYRCGLVTVARCAGFQAVFIGLGVSSLAVDSLVGAKARWSCALVNFSQLIEAQNRSVKTMMPLRRLQPTLDNRHPARKLIMLGGE